MATSASKIQHGESYLRHGRAFGRYVAAAQSRVVPLRRDASVDGIRVMCACCFPHDSPPRRDRALHCCRPSGCCARMRRPLHLPPICVCDVCSVHMANVRAPWSSWLGAYWMLSICDQILYVFLEMAAATLLLTSALRGRRCTLCFRTIVKSRQSFTCQPRLQSRGSIALPGVASFIFYKLVSGS